MTKNPEEPIFGKYQAQHEYLKRKMSKRRKEIKEEESKPFYSAKFSVMDFLLFRGEYPQSLEGLIKLLSSVTYTNPDGEKTTWLQLYEKFLENEKLREAFGFSRIERTKLKDEESELFYSAKLSVIDFLLSRGKHPQSLEGLAKLLGSVTHTSPDGKKQTWLELYEKFLKNEELREAFGFSGIQKDDSEE